MVKGYPTYFGEGVLSRRARSDVPGLVKLKTVKKPATKDRQGINPFTKEPMTIKGSAG